VGSLNDADGSLNGANDANRARGHSLAAAESPAILGAFASVLTLAYLELRYLLHNVERDTFVYLGAQPKGRSLNCHVT
jgi:hypothetical protein